MLIKSVKLETYIYILTNTTILGWLWSFVVNSRLEITCRNCLGNPKGGMAHRLPDSWVSNILCIFIRNIINFGDVAFLPSIRSRPKFKSGVTNWKMKLNSKVSIILFTSIWSPKKLLL